MARRGVQAMSTALPLWGLATLALAQSPAPQVSLTQISSPGLISGFHTRDNAPEVPAVSQDFAPQSQPWSVPAPHRTVQLDSKGRWGVRLDMQQPSGRDVQLKDVQAGAYVNFGPRIRVGGSVGLGDRFEQPQRLTPQDTAPRVHLETAFKF